MPVLHAGALTLPGRIARLAFVRIGRQRLADLGPAEREALAQDAHGSATLMALLFCLWGLVSLPFVPWHPFGVPNAFQAIVGGLAFGYFLRQRKQPSVRVALWFSGLAIAYSLVLLPWTAVVWCSLGRPWEAFTVPQVGILVMALVVPAYFWLGAPLMALFAAESLFAYLHARHVGLAALVPTSEPYFSILCTVLGVGLLVMRRQRRQLGRRHVEVQAESAALHRLDPWLARVREELGSQPALIAEALHHLNAAGDEASTKQRMLGTVDRLVGIGDTLEKLARDEPAVVPAAKDRARREPPHSAISEAERRLRDRDANVGATAFAALVTALAAASVFFHFVNPEFRPLLVGATLVGAATLLLLVSRRRNPSESISLGAVLLLWGMVLPFVSSNQWYLLAQGRPYTPFLGHKLLLLILPLAAASRRWLSLTLILLTALDAMVLYFLLDLGAHKDIVSLAEPWVTLVFVVMGVVLVVMREQRRVSSIGVLRGEAEVAALHRYAGLLLALRDQLNSPLQTMVLCVNQLELRCAPQEVAPIRTGLARLTALSHELTELDSLVPSGSRRVSLDAAEELRRRV